MKLGSLFDGSGGFPLAGALHGIKPVWASEIEPYPISVTKSRFPNMLHLGDIATINGAQIEPVDIITFGSPCQDMSVAGKRIGLQDGKRSNLFYEAIRIIKEMRNETNGKYPRYAVWENVPGAFSSNSGEDFRCVIESFCQIIDKRVTIPKPDKWNPAGYVRGGGYSVVWRTIDAQYWGVPQRRRRIYLVADFASERADKILFERKSLYGDSAESAKARKRVTKDAQGCVRGSSGIRCLNPWDCQSKRQYSIDGTYPCLDAGDGSGGQAHGIVYSIDALSSNSMKSANPNSGFHETQIAKCLDTSNGNPTKNQGGQVIVERCAAFMGGQGAKAGGLGYRVELSPTLKATPSGNNTVPDVVTKCFQQNAEGRSASLCYALQANGIDRADTAGCSGCGWRTGAMYTLNTIDKHCVAYDARGNGNGTITPTLTGDHENRVTDYTTVCCQNTGQGWWNESEVAGTIRTPCGGDSIKTNLVITKSAVRRKYIVRRLTPLECARLQGFPDWWGLPEIKSEMNDEEISFWEGVRKTYCMAMGKKYSPQKSRDAMVRWYNGLHSDSSEYKMWGNGICRQCAEFVLMNIVHNSDDDLIL